MPSKKPLNQKTAEQQFTANYFEHLTSDSLQGNGSSDNALLCAVDLKFGAAQTVYALSHNGLGDKPLLGTMAIKQAIEDQTQAFISDEVAAATDMLYGHIAVLNTMFNSYAQIAAACRKPEGISAFFDMAIKAQEQARKTLQTLHDIKNPKPRTVFIKNAIAQQVNQLVTKTEELQKRIETQNVSPIDIETVQSSKQKKFPNKIKRDRLKRTEQNGYKEDPE